MARCGPAATSRTLKGCNGARLHAPVVVSQRPGTLERSLLRGAGTRAGPGSSKVILEAFKPGTAPSDSSAMYGTLGPDGQPLGVTPEVDRAVRTGTGGLY